MAPQIIHQPICGHSDYQTKTAYTGQSHDKTLAFQLFSFAQVFFGFHLTSQLYQYIRPILVVEGLLPHRDGSIVVGHGLVQLVLREE